MGVEGGGAALDPPFFPLHWSKNGLQGGEPNSYSEILCGA
jgi:hypothetical protein